MRERYREERATLKRPNGAARREAAPFNISFERTTTVVRPGPLHGLNLCCYAVRNIAVAAQLGRSLSKMMSAIEKIKDKLRKYPQLNCQIEGNKISVEPSSTTGFTVWLIDNDPGYTVGFDGWHEEFENQDEALNCFAFGLSDKCRLKVAKRGNKPYSWTVESKIGKEWNEDSKTGLIFVPFWKTKTIEYLSNPIINTSEPVTSADARTSRR